MNYSHVVNNSYSPCVHQGTETKLNTDKTVVTASNVIEAIRNNNRFSLILGIASASCYCLTLSISKILKKKVVFLSLTTIYLETNYFQADIVLM